ncbi:phosphopantetheine-binding protein [Streptomyces sp. NPDC046805]|uniref:phosphopantetheine-binding protein n=1 Tax=Streptomyces sp. NPDC046805 TaxID=3155134 RepID=UPI0033EE2F6C
MNRGEVATAIADVWRSVLDVQNLGPGDDFFALGGDSLAALAMANEVAGLFSQGVRDEHIEELAMSVYDSPSLHAFTAAVGTMMTEKGES